MEWELPLRRGLAPSECLGYLFLCTACKGQTARQDRGKSSHPFQDRHRKDQLESVMSRSRMFLNSSWKIMAAALI